MVKNRVIAFVLALCFLFSCCFTTSAETALNEDSKGYIDNSDLVPPYVTDDKVELISINGGKLQSPDWVKTLVIEEINIQNCSPNGKFSGMTYVLDHLQEMGVNGIWLDPIYGGQHYLNYGPATVDSYITGANDYEEGWKVVAEFIKEAHKRNIRVFLDIVTWGVSPFAPLLAKKPEWFSEYYERYNGYKYDWTNPELTEWFANELIDIVHKTDIDGFRCDCGIDYGCKDMYVKVRSKLYEEENYIILIGEAVNDETADIFDFAEHSIDTDIKTEGELYINGQRQLPIVVKTGFGLDTTSSQTYGEAGMRTYYTSLVSCHDTTKYMVSSNIVNIAYSSILAPFIPLWYCGEEWNNTYTSTGWLWANGTYWNELEKNRDFFEKFKIFMRIRRLYPEIFNYYPDNHRDSNICSVSTDHEDPELVAYARYTDEKAIMVIPNQGEENDRFSVEIPYKNMGLDENTTYTLVNLLSNKVIGTGKGTDFVGFETTIEDKNVAVYLIRPAVSGEQITVTSKINYENAPMLESTEKYPVVDEQPGDKEGKYDEDSEPVTIKKKKIPSETIYETYIPWGAIIGISVGVIIVSAIVIYFVIRKKKQKKSIV